MHKRESVANLDEYLAELFETIYKSTSKPTNISDNGLITLLSPLVKAAVELKNEPFAEQLDQMIQSQGEKFIEKLKHDRIEDEIEFQKFRRQFAIRSILHNYYECEQSDMTFRKLYNHLQPQCPNMTAERLKSWLNRLGFCIVVVPHNREIVIEMHSQKLARLKYIRRIQSLRQAERNIVYFREVTITLKPTKTSKTSDTEELTVFFAANGHTGLLNFAFVERDSKTTQNFIEWLTIISGNQPKKNTVLVIEPKIFSAPAKSSIFSGFLPTSFKYERIYKNYNTFIPSASSNSDAYSVEMLDFCWQNCEAGIIVKKSSNDPTKYLEDDGFVVLHLPCLHTELSPMHQIDFPKLFENITDKDRSIDKIKNIIRTRLDSSTAEEWKHYMEEAIRVENDFLRFEALLSEEDEAIEMDDSSDDVQIIDETRETVTLSDDDD